MCHWSITEEVKSVGIIKTINKNGEFQKPFLIPTQRDCMLRSNIEGY
jgi:hypothetical protein